MTFWGLTESVVVDCDYRVDPTYGYKCDVLNSELIISKDDQVITRARGYHLQGKTNDDVKYFKAYSKRVSFFPRGIKKVFKNIENIYFNLAQLQEITKEDLHEFGDSLKFLALDRNQIEFLESDLFSYNKNLENVYFFKNKIKHVDYDTFGGLNNLQTLMLSNNPCTTSDDNTYDRLKLLAIIRKVEGSCQDTNFMNSRMNKKLEAENILLKVEIAKLRGECECPCTSA